MIKSSGRSTTDGSGRQFWFLAAFLGVLWFAGGSVRADALGQVVVRLAAWTVVILAVLHWRPASFSSTRTVGIFITVTVLAVVMQLIPLPPVLWTALPGRAVLVATAEAASLPQPWRPLSISPGATFNALGSLIVPVATYIAAVRLSRHHHERLAIVIWFLVIGGCIIGLLQLSGGKLDNPLINEMQGLVSGNLANRNHFALFVSIGILLTLVLAIRGPNGGSRKFLPLLLLLPLLVLMVLATGSRMGIVLSVIAASAGLFITRRELAHRLSNLKRVHMIMVLGIISSATIIIVLLAFGYGRTDAVDRLALDAGSDMRLQAAPTVLKMMMDYLPWGSGFGTFDPAFRIAEPDDLLRTVYFNHAHSDWLEIISDGGLIGAAMGVFALGWWLWSSKSIWRARQKHDRLPMAQIGSTVIGLVMIASITDYPARTPIFMAMLTLAGMWMVGGRAQASTASSVDDSLPAPDARSKALPDTPRRL